MIYASTQSPREPGQRPSIQLPVLKQPCHMLRGMENALFHSSCKGRCLGLAVLMLSLQTTVAIAQGLDDAQTKSLPVEQDQTLKLGNRTQVSYDSYILGPGDGLQIELLDLPELSGQFVISPDGTIHMPRLRSLTVEGLTIEELRYFLTQQFSTYVRDPQVYIRPIAYRPVRIYVGGEVKRPGYYTLGGIEIDKIYGNGYSTKSGSFYSRHLGARVGMLHKDQLSHENNIGRQFVLPTVFDAIRRAQGITPYSDLSKVRVTRKRALGQGGGRVQTDLNFISLFTEGNESQNIRLFDGDVLTVKKSDKIMRDQLLKAGQTNLSPQFMNVFVSGRVKSPGAIAVPQGAMLNQAIAVAGGPKLLRGKVEFIRFTPEGEVDRRIFSYNSSAVANGPNNPVLMAGDLINIRDSPLSATTTVLNEFTTPFMGIYSIYAIFDN